VRFHRLRGPLDSQQPPHDIVRVVRIEREAFVHIVAVTGLAVAGHVPPRLSGYEAASRDAAIGRDAR